MPSIIILISTGTDQIGGESFTDVINRVTPRLTGHCPRVSGGQYSGGYPWWGAVCGIRPPVRLFPSGFTPGGAG